ncbi:aminotransferase class V-fold PLP-dependent enzyme [Pseudonocardia acaciae]|uniref:aminotransferase class V-fold PLP-dependent enzyme n=1 Tax=Pseudonocardia acaciae TaxID=551276 RepID=UPI0012EE8E85|nr:aminotransferase class V-fold PLP-dependent enzyme [Pseudonocardia acaciae]
MQDTRRDFPVLSELTYLTTASVGLVPRPVLAAAQEFERDLADRGTTGFDEATELAVYDTARNAAARLLNAPAHTIALASSMTEALCQVAWWLKPSAPANVVSTDVDFPSNTYPWFRIAEETGLDVRLVPVADDPLGFDVDRVARYVDHNTAAISISHVQFGTGHRLDLRALADLAHAHDALLIVDATQSAGQVPLDVAADDVDVLITGSYKWLCSTFGAALCYLRPELWERFNPPLVGWRSAPDAYALHAHWQGLAPDARRMEFSTMSYTATVALGAAVDYVLALDPETIRKHNLALTRRLMTGLTGLGAELITPDRDELRAGTVTARFPGHNGEAVAAEIIERGVIVSPRAGGTRYSAHFYNTEDDIDTALNTTADVLAAMRAMRATR